jgi:glutathione S-transferase
MSITLFHHPYSRAANVVWMLEEVGLPYELRFVDLAAGEHKTAAYHDVNPMGKLPTLIDGDVVVTETAAIGVYLADRFGQGRLAPALDEAARGTYLRWCFIPSAVIEPGCMAHAANWAFKPGSAGWGTWEEMLDTIEQGIGQGPWLLGDRFSMADVILGGTLRWMLGFKMIDARPAFVDYAARLSERPAAVRAAERNAAIVTERGLAR